MEEEIKTNEEKKDEVVIKIKKDNLWKYSTFILLAVVIVGGFMMFKDGNSPVTGNVVVDNPEPVAPSEPSKVRVSFDDDAVLGDKDAPVTIVEFSDYQCPFCGRHYSQTFPLIKSQYIDSGKVKIVYRDFPLESIHPQATPAAIAAECVKEKGGDEAYFKMHDKLFENQQTLSAENYKAWAKELGYDISSCLDSGKYRGEVQKDLQDATAAGGQGTPFFVVVGKDGSGTPISGAQPFQAFQQAIESYL